MRAEMNRVRRPLWLPASNYYVLAVAISAAFFFLVWGILHDGGEETPWITAGVGASIVLAGTVVLREIVLRRARDRYIRQQRMMENRVFSEGRSVSRKRSGKLSLERNAAILSEIRKKSDAAKVLNSFSAGHREVFELCSGYLARSEADLRTVSAGSPRLTALLKGRNAAADYHRFHLLRWAEIEARTHADEARSRTNTEEKIESAQNALNVIDTALESYPSESSLLESQQVLRELIVSIKVSGRVDEAERAAFEGDYAQAKSLYRDALFYLGRDNVQSTGRQQAASKINAEIDRLRALENKE